MTLLTAFLWTVEETGVSTQTEIMETQGKHANAMQKGPTQMLDLHLLAVRQQC